MLIESIGVIVMASNLISSVDIPKAIPMSHCSRSLKSTRNTNCPIRSRKESGTGGSIIVMDGTLLHSVENCGIVIKIGMEGYYDSCQ